MPLKLVQNESPQPRTLSDRIFASLKRHESFNLSPTGSVLVPHDELVDWLNESDILEREAAKRSTCDRLREIIGGDRAKTGHRN